MFEGGLAKGLTIEVAFIGVMIICALMIGLTYWVDWYYPRQDAMKAQQKNEAESCDSSTPS